MTVLDVRGVRKTSGRGHRRRVLLDDVSFSIGERTVFGYLGPNGAGKTTTLRVLMGLACAQAGSVSFFGMPWGDARWRARVGFQPEQPYLYDYLTAEEYLDYVGRLRGLPHARRRERAAAELERLGLSRSAREPLRRYSKGMLQRLALAQALLAEPELLILDEPMSGLDPIGRRVVRDVIAQQRHEGRSVFFSTHILPDAEALCDRVAIIKSGRVMAQGVLAEILSVEVSHLEVLASGVSEEAVASLATPVIVHRFGERVRFEVEESVVMSLLAELTGHGARLLGVQPVRQSLEDFFLERVGEQGEGRRWTFND